MTKRFLTIEDVAKKDRAFDCALCGVPFEPEKGQWIFHDLCDGCFDRYDEQKMRGRFASIGLAPPPTSYVEDSATWIEEQIKARS